MTITGSPPAGAHTFSASGSIVRIAASSLAMNDIVRDFHMIPARSMPEALAIAEGLIGKKDYSVTVLPEGISVIPLGE